MIASAVTIPAQEEPLPQEHSTSRNDVSPSLKRKFSGSYSHANKRPHATPDDSLNYDDAPRSSISSTSPSTRPSPELRRVRPNLAEEKKRNQRLFGGILGVVSQRTASTTSAHRKRDEIEARARERQRKEHEEHEAERVRRKESVRRKRDAQQKVWAREAQARKHENMRHMAGFLLTKTQPRLYYKPWELLSGDEEVLQRQREEVEDQIRREQGQTSEPENTARDQSESDAPAQPDSLGERPEPSGTDDAQISVPDEAESQRQEGSNDAAKESIAKPDPEPVAESDHDMQDDDHHDGELVEGEGQEDDVIY